MKRFFKIGFVVAIIAVGIFANFKYLAHASAKDLKSLSLTVTGQTAAKNQSAGQSQSLSSVTADMNAAIKADPDGLTTSATLVDLDNGQTYNAGAASTPF